MRRRPVDGGVRSRFGTSDMVQHQQRVAFSLNVFLSMHHRALFGKSACK